MNSRFLSFLLFLALVAGILYLSSKRSENPNLNQKGFVKSHEKAIDSLQRQVRDLKALISTIEQKAYKDSLKFSVVLTRNKSEIQRLKNNAQKVNFMHYTDRQLDSLISVLYPD